MSLMRLSQWACAFARAVQYWVRHTRARAVPFYYERFSSVLVSLLRLDRFRVELLTGG